MSKKIFLHVQAIDYGKDQAKTLHPLFISKLFFSKVQTEKPNIVYVWCDPQLLLYTQCKDMMNDVGQFDSRKMEKH